MTTLECWKTGLPAAVVISVAGCNTFNDQIDLVGTDSLPALAIAAEETELSGTPSLMHGLDRQSWSTVMVQVPRDQVAHPPTYAINFRWEAERGPWNPAYPAAIEAVDDPTDTGQDVADAVAEPFVTAAMLVWAPIDMIFITQPWEQRRSPSEPYALVRGAAPAHLVDWFAAPQQPQR